MYSNIFETSVIVSNIAFCFMNIVSPVEGLIEAMDDFVAFERDMEEIRISSL